VGRSWCKPNGTVVLVDHAHKCGVTFPLPVYLFIFNSLSTLADVAF
jgi:hypothetical protein